MPDAEDSDKWEEQAAQDPEPEMEAKGTASGLHEVLSRMVKR